MEIETCKSGEHKWACITKKGALGEIETTRPLTAGQINLLKQNPSKINEVCPNGVVRCSIDGSPFIPEQRADDAPNFADLRKKLIH